MSATVKYAIKNKATGQFYNARSGTFSDKPQLWAKRADRNKYADMVVRTIAREVMKPNQYSTPTDWWVSMKVEDVLEVTLTLQETSARPAWEMYGHLIHPETGQRAPTGQFWAKHLLTHDWFLEEIGTPYTLSPASETYHCS